MDAVTTGSREPVKLVVKSPNQQFDDMTVDCEPQWNIKKLKEHLAEVYPCKPTPDEQKLIYSGQLLKDQLILKDILRHYDDPQPQFHILHLVYTSKNQRFSSIKTSQRGNNDVTTTDGLRHRNVVTTDSQQIQSQNANMTSTNMTSGVSATVASSTNCPSSRPSASGLNNIPAFGYPQQPNQYLLAQQMAMQNWMQQAYVQYMNQYMNLLSEGMRPEAVFMQHQAQPQMPYAPQSLPFTPPVFGQGAPSTAIPQNAAGTPDSPQVATNANVANAAAPAAAAVEQPPQAQDPQPQPRFPNLVQDNAEENRDWLDIFYIVIRLMVLLTLVYVYSSVVRIAIVVFIGLAIYLYHIGFFRRHIQQAREANNNNVAAAVENIQQQQQQQHNQGVNANGDNLNQNDDEPPADGRQVVNSNREGDNDGSRLPSSTTVPETPEVAGTSVIAFVRTFVVSFFVSLLPETPAL